MSSIKGILFDKDGTLMEFDSVWIPVGVELVMELLQEVELQEISLARARKQLLEALGIKGTAIAPEGIFLWGTAAQIAEVLKTELVRLGAVSGSNDSSGFELVIREKINRLLAKNAGAIKPRGDVRALLAALRQRGIFIGLATSDTLEASRLCLKQMNIDQYFDYIGADNGIAKTKPHPQLLQDFCSVCDIKPGEIIVVGDSLNDVLFAKNGEAALSILIGEGSYPVQSSCIGMNAVIQPDIFIRSVDELMNRSGGFIWD